MSILRILARHAGSGKGPVPVPGQSPIRIDGRAEVTGAARYPSDMGVPNRAWVFRFARGRVTAIDETAARAASGVLDILSHRNMRSSPELPCMFGIEHAMGAVAHALKLGPILLRRRNDTLHEPIRGLPWASRGSMCCFDAGVKAIGGARRNPEPWSMWEGDWPVGIDCGSTNSKPRRG